MNKFIFIKTIIIYVFFSSFNYAQQEDTLSSSEWNFDIETDFYFTDPSIFLPILIADHGNLHLEARYNYEDINTASAWVGYNIFGGDEFEYFITPMIGGAFGRTSGIAPGFEFTFNYIGVEIYSESEYLFDFESKENNFFYNWTDITYSPLDWIWFGISGQITKIYKTDFETDRGVLLGAAFHNSEFTFYFYNIATDNAFGMLSLAVEF